MNFAAELQDSVRYLESDRALMSVDADPYWPKWNSPWWHILLLHEMGETQRIPAGLIERHVAALNRIRVKIFPTRAEDIPEGVDIYRDIPCHCQLGNTYQVLAAWGLDVDRELPWMRPWFLRYQMADGGLNCDDEAYRVKDEVPSSMVGTIAVFEAVLLHTPRPWTAEERSFLDHGARFLIGRQLTRGSETRHNARERESAKNWLKPCFPRFYLYDVLRGLNALLLWAERAQQPLPAEAIRDVVTGLGERFPDGMIRNERHSYAGVGTLLQSPSGEWLRRQPATMFPLLTKVSATGEVSPFLSRQWSEARRRIANRPELAELLR